MAESLPTLEIGQPNLPSNKSSPSSANLTARLYEVSTDSQVVHLPEVQPKSRLKIKGNILSKDRLQKPKKAAALTPAEATEENICYSDSDSDSSCSSYSSSESRSPGAYLNSEKTEADQLRRFSLSNTTRSSSQETISDSPPPLCASVSLPSVLPFSTTGESRSVKKMKRHVASNLLRHNHHILLHRGQTALNSHIQITVNTKAANEIAAHAVVTEVPALLPSHRQRAHLAALSGQRSPVGMPPASPKALSVIIPGGHAASPSNHSSPYHKSPALSPRGTALLSPLHSNYSKSPQAAKDRSAASSPSHNIPSIPEAN